MVWIFSCRASASFFFSRSRGSTWIASFAEPFWVNCAGSTRSGLSPSWARMRLVSWTEQEISPLSSEVTALGKYPAASRSSSPAIPAAQLRAAGALHHSGLALPPHTAAGPACRRALYTPPGGRPGAGGVA
eukprot:scaffold2585_cov368-Prasinococcus_capsulatus_cf.AAC.2